MTESDWRTALFARRTLGVRLGTDALERVLDALLPGVRERPPFTVTQVVGTNGKGSTAAMLAHALGQAELGPIGLYTSPHLFRVGERIRIDGVAIADEDVEVGVLAVADAERRAGVSLSFFEVLTAIALERFVAAGCRHVVLEAGLGGRLDATTAVARDQVLIAHIARDHEQFLGDTIAAIAFEKAAVIRANLPVHSVAQVDEARAVIEAVARERGATLEFVAPLDHPPRGLLGDHQRHNAALALAGLRQLIGSQAAPELLDDVRWPGRLERRDLGGGVLWLDVAHNLDGVEALAVALVELNIQPSVIVFGTLADKPGPAMAAVLRQHAPLWLVPPTAEGAYPLAAIARPGEREFESVDHPSLLAGLRSELAKGATVLVCGSHHLVGGLASRLADPSAARPDPGDPMPRGLR